MLHCCLLTLAVCCFAYSPFPFQSTDETVVTEEMRHFLHSIFPNSRFALLKYGGDWPYLSVPEEVNLHLIVHLRVHGLFPNDKIESKKNQRNEYEHSVVSVFEQI